MDVKMKLCAISGSLRKSSYNTAALEALMTLAPNSITITLASIADLPLFNPDIEDQNIPALTQLKAYLAESQGLIIASPEYAHGISGPLKNALDWLVSGAEFPLMPVMLINTSPRASYAQKSLQEVLTTMSGVLIKEAHLSLPLLGSNLNAKGIIEDKDLSARLTNSLERFCRIIENS